jgi:hypothetical protein
MCPVPHLRPTTTRNVLIRKFSFMHFNYGALGGYASSQRPLCVRTIAIYTI